MPEGKSSVLFRKMRRTVTEDDAPIDVMESIATKRLSWAAGAVSNVNVYVIDTGVGAHADLNLVNHVNFQWFWKTPPNAANPEGGHIPVMKTA